MHIPSFQDLLLAARQQEEPQRLLFVFTSADLPGDATPEQRLSPGPYGLTAGKDRRLTQRLTVRCTVRYPSSA